MSKKNGKPQSPSHNITSRRTVSPIKRGSPLNLDFVGILPDATSNTASPIASPKNSPKKKTYKEIKEDTFEDILEGFKYKPLRILKDNDKPEFIVCNDPVGNIVYIDIRGEKGHCGSNNIIEINEVEKDDISCKGSIINTYKDIVKGETHGVVINSDNELIFICQDDTINVITTYKKILSSGENISKTTVFPMISFYDATSSDKDIECIEHTNKVKKSIRERQIKDVNLFFDDVVDSLNTLLTIVKSLQTQHKITVKECLKKQKEYGDMCYNYYKSFSEIENGLTEEEYEDYDKKLYLAIEREKSFVSINSQIVSLSTIVPRIDKINEELKGEIKILEEETENLSIEQIES